MTSRAIVLSVPYSGTHFTMKLLSLMGVEAEYTHFEPNWEYKIEARLLGMWPGERVILPYRPEVDIAKSWHDRNMVLREYHQAWDVKDRLMPLLSKVGFFMLPVERSMLRWEMVRALQTWLGVAHETELSSELFTFIKDWPRVASWDPVKNDWRDESKKQLSGLMSSRMLKENGNGT